MSPDPGLAAWRLLIPGGGCQIDDLSLAGVLDEGAAEELLSHAGKHSIGDLLDDEHVRLYDLLTVDSDATIVEVSALMADARAQVAQVKGEPGDPPMFLTLCAPVDTSQADA